MKFVVIAFFLILFGYIGFSFFSPSTENMNIHEPVSESTSTPVTPGTYTAIPEESLLNWEGRKTLIKDYKDVGTIGIKEGTLTVSETQVTGKFVMDMNTIVVENTGKGPAGAGLEKHLKSESFFDVTKHPTAEFEITSATPGAEALTYTVHGKLTMKGITNEISFPATVYAKDGRLHARATMEIDRTKWDIRYGSDKFFDNLANNVIDDNFTLKLHLMAKAI